MCRVAHILKSQCPSTFTKGIHCREDFSECVPAPSTRPPAPVICHSVLSLVSVHTDTDTDTDTGTHIHIRVHTKTWWAFKIRSIYMHTYTHIRARIYVYEYTYIYLAYTYIRVYTPGMYVYSYTYIRIPAKPRAQPAGARLECATMYIRVCIYAYVPYIRVYTYLPSLALSLLVRV